MVPCSIRQLSAVLQDSADSGIRLCKFGSYSCKLRGAPAHWPRTTVLLAATKQLYEWFSPSVCPSVHPTFWLCSHHRIIMNFSVVITNVESDVHAKGQAQMSKVKITEVITQLSRFRTVSPVWIHWWWWNDALSLMLLWRGALLFFKVNRQISRSHVTKKIVNFDPNWAFPDCTFSFKSPMAMK